MYLSKASIAGLCCVLMASISPLAQAASSAPDEACDFGVPEVREAEDAAEAEAPATPADVAAKVANIHEQIDALAEKYPDAPFNFDWMDDQVTVYQLEDYNADNPDHRAFRKAAFDTLSTSGIRWNYVPPALHYVLPTADVD